MVFCVYLDNVIPAEGPWISSLHTVLHTSDFLCNRRKTAIQRRFIVPRICIYCSYTAMYIARVYSRAIQYTALDADPLVAPRTACARHATPSPYLAAPSHCARYTTHKLRSGNPIQMYPPRTWNMHIACTLQTSQGTAPRGADGRRQCVNMVALSNVFSNPDLASIDDRITRSEPTPRRSRAAATGARTRAVSQPRRDAQRKPLPSAPSQ